MNHITHTLVSMALARAVVLQDQARSPCCVDALVDIAREGLQKTLSEFPPDLAQYVVEDVLSVLVEDVPDIKRAQWAWFEVRKELLLQA